MTSLNHGNLRPRGLDETPRQRSYEGRFGRMFQGLTGRPAHDPTKAEDVQILRQLAATMRESGEAVADNPSIPSGYVYLGQFVDHDVTFDPSSQLQKRNDPEGLIDFRTPRFDLDSVYGTGPDAAPYLYDNAPGATHQGHAFLLTNTFDMPRNSQGRALIGDPRNDENGIVSQLHVAFLRLHNRLMDDLMPTVADPADRFKNAQETAQWHYQWVVVHDFLRRTIGSDVLDDLVVRTGQAGEIREAAHLRYYRHKVNPYLPVEFSVAAYRFGHSQVRDEYSINSSFHGRLFDPNGDDFRGFQSLRSGWQAAWPFFFEFDTQGPQQSRLIDTSLSPTLSTLQGGGGDDADLALRNLLRGAALGLPCGEDVARAMRIEPLTTDLLAPAEPGRTPLWFYILREAQVLQGGQRLGPVGGRIVGETLVGLLRADPRSYLSQDPTWVPTLPTRGGDARSFDMVDLITHAVPDQITR